MSKQFLESKIFKTFIEIHRLYKKIAYTFISVDKFNAKIELARIAIDFKVLSTRICNSVLYWADLSIQFDLKISYGNLPLSNVNNDPKYDGTKISVAIAIK